MVTSESIVFQSGVKNTWYAYVSAVRARTEQNVAFFESSTPSVIPEKTAVRSPRLRLKPGWMQINNARASTTRYIVRRWLVEPLFFA